MERHSTDFVELLFGLAFLALGGAFIVHQASDRSFDAAWIAAIGLVTVGAAFLATTVLHRPRRALLGNATLDAAPVEAPVATALDTPVAAPIEDRAPSNDVGADDEVAP